MSTKRDNISGLRPLLPTEHSKCISVTGFCFVLFVCLFFLVINRRMTCRNWRFPYLPLPHPVPLRVVQSIHFEVQRKRGKRERGGGGAKQNEFRFTYRFCRHLRSAVSKISPNNVRELNTSASDDPPFRLPKVKTLTERSRLPPSIRVGVGSV